MILIENENALNFDIQKKFPSGKLEKELLIQNCRIESLILGDFIYEKPVTLNRCFIEIGELWLVNQGGYRDSFIIESCIFTSYYSSGNVPSDLASGVFNQLQNKLEGPRKRVGFDCFSQNKGKIYILGNIFYPFVDFSDSTFEELLTVEGNVFLQGSNLCSDIYLRAEFLKGLSLKNNVGHLDIK